MSESISRRRWIAKKSARAAMAFGSLSTGALALRERMRIAPAVRVLTYHRFGDATREPFRVSGRAFEAQVRYLAERRLALSLRELESVLAGTLSPRPGSALVTIDDGSESVHRIALPILRHHAIPAVLFTVAGAMGATDGPFAEAPERYLGWDELAELAEGGIEVQSHSMTHRSMARISRDEARDEAAQSKALLEARLGRPVTSFAYPFGTRRDYDASTSSVLADAGYRTVFTSQHGAVCAGMDPTELPRAKIEGGEGMAMFRLVLSGGLDGWGLVDRALPALQRPR